jgi:heat shock protein HspQ
MRYGGPDVRAQVAVIDFSGAETRDDAIGSEMNKIRLAKYAIGQVVRHRFYPFRGVVFDIDPVFDNTEEWWQSIPEDIRPHKDQPFYHLLAENAETEYVAYVSEQNLLPDDSGTPLRHPKVLELFAETENGEYQATFVQEH